MPLWLLRPLGYIMIEQLLTALHLSDPFPKVDIVDHTISVIITARRKMLVSGGLQHGIGYLARKLQLATDLHVFGVIQVSRPNYTSNTNRLLLPATLQRPR